MISVWKQRKCYKYIIWYLLVALCFSIVMPCSGFHLGALLSSLPLLWIYFTNAATLNPCTHAWLLLFELPLCPQCKRTALIFWKQSCFNYIRPGFVFFFKEISIGDSGNVAKIEIQFPEYFCCEFLLEILKTKKRWGREISKEKGFNKLCVV